MSVLEDPTITQQRMEALLGRGGATAVRLRRSACKRALREHLINPAAVLRNPPWFMQSMRVFEFLEACPGIGEEKIRRLNVRAMGGFSGDVAVNLFRELGELTERQKEWLIEQLPALTRSGPQSP